VRFFGSSRTSLVQAEFGALFVVLTAALIQLTGFVDSPLYPLVYLGASILALVFRPLIGCCLLAMLLAADVVPRLVGAQQPAAVIPALAGGSILLLFFGFFLLYARFETRRREELSRRLSRFEDDLSGIAGSVFDREEDVSQEKIDREAVRALHGIDDLRFDILDRTRGAIGADSVAYLVPAAEDLLRVREAASADDLFDYDTGIPLDIYRPIITRKEPMLLVRGQGSGGLDTGYYRKRPFGTACLAAVPVMEGGEVVGILACDRQQDAPLTDRDIQFLGVVAVMLRDVERIIVQYKKLSVDLTEYEQLYGISRALAQAKGIEEVFETVYEFCRRMLSVSTVVFTLTKKSESAIVSIHGRGLGSVPKKTFPHAGSLVGWVIENRKYLVFPEKERKRNVFGRRIELSDDGSLALFPLLWEERVIGTCCLVVPSNKRPSSFHVRLVEVILNMAVVSYMGIRSTIQLRRQAVTDPLTGLYNRRSFTKAMGRLLEQADRYGEPISLLMIDIDRFKSINDTYGHSAGDDVIRAVADTILSSIRKVDVAARIGGEEFAVILPKSVKKSSLDTAERIRKAIKKRVVSHGRREISVTVSIGIATRSDGNATGDILVKQADRCLYAAKEAGRDRCVVT
jgi:diguanylate cyclase (GGDEF)-like protein